MLLQDVACNVYIEKKQRLLKSFKHKLLIIKWITDLNIDIKVKEKQRKCFSLPTLKTKRPVRVNVINAACNYLRFRSLDNNLLKTLPEEMFHFNTELFNL